MYRLRARWPDGRVTTRTSLLRAELEPLVDNWAAAGADVVFSMENDVLRRGRRQRRRREPGLTPGRTVR